MLRLLGAARRAAGRTAAFAARTAHAAAAFRGGPRVRASGLGRALFLLEVRARSFAPAPLDGPRVCVIALPVHGPEEQRLVAERLAETAYRSVEIFAGSLSDPVDRVSGDLVLFLDPRIRPIRADWLGRLVAQVSPGAGSDGPLGQRAEPCGSTRVAAGAVLVQRGPSALPGSRPLTVVARGQAFQASAGYPLPVPLGTGEDPLPGLRAASPCRPVPAIAPGLILADRAALASVAGTSALTDLRSLAEAMATPFGAAELSLRLRAIDVTPVVHRAVLAWAPDRSGGDGGAELTPPANGTDDATRESFVGRWGPCLYRAALRSALMGKGDGASDELLRSLEIVVLTGDRPSAETRRRAKRIVDSARRAGWSASKRSIAAAKSPPVSRMAGSPDVLVAVDPAVDGRSLPLGSVRVAWVAGDAPRWTASDGFDEFDVVLVADPAAEAHVTASTHRVPRRVDLLAEPADSLRIHLLAWVDAPRVGIRVGPAAWTVARNWGDYHFGRDLQRAFERAGWPARLWLRDDWGALAAARDNVTVHLFGMAAAANRPSQVNVLWQISHPELAAKELYDSYDLQFVASLPFAARMTEVTGRPVEPLLQATDPEQFRPAPGGSAADVLFVANYRPGRVVEGPQPLHPGLAVYGKGWADRLDPALIRGAHIANAQLGAAYAAASVVLNDTWAGMRDEGFISNRIFDALASGAFVVSDDIRSLDEVLPGVVPTYRARDELPALLDRWLADPGGRRTRATKGRDLVLAAHTFEHRASRILETVFPLLADRSCGLSAVHAP